MRLRLTTSGGKNGGARQGKEWKALNKAELMVEVARRGSHRSRDGTVEGGGGTQETRGAGNGVAWGKRWWEHEIEQGERSSPRQRRETEVDGGRRSAVARLAAGAGGGDEIPTLRWTKIQSTLGMTFLRPGAQSDGSGAAVASAERRIVGGAEKKCGCLLRWNLPRARGATKRGQEGA